MQTLANAIPGTGAALGDGGGGTREQADWFEFDLRHIPLMARWLAQYRVKSFGTVSNNSVDDLEGGDRRGLRRRGRRVRQDQQRRPRPGADRLRRRTRRPSRSRTRSPTPGFAHDGVLGRRAVHAADGHGLLRQGRPAGGARSGRRCGSGRLGDGSRRLARPPRHPPLRRHPRQRGPAGAGSRISLGTWYAEDGRTSDVVGHFVDDGRGLHGTIGGPALRALPARQRSRTARPGARSGTTPLRRPPPRGTRRGARARASTARDDWPLGHRARRLARPMRIGADPSYVQAADGPARRAWIDPGATPHQVDAHVDFGGDNRDQPFQLLVHTREDGLMGGVTSLGRARLAGRGAHVAQPVHDHRDGTLRWYRHIGRPRAPSSGTRRRSWTAAGTASSAVFGGGDGVIYAIRPTARSSGTTTTAATRAPSSGAVRAGRHGLAGLPPVLRRRRRRDLRRHARGAAAVVPAPRPPRRHLPLAGPVPGRHRLERLHRRGRRAGRHDLRRSCPTARCSGTATTAHDQGYPIWTGRRRRRHRLAGLEASGPPATATSTAATRRRTLALAPPRLPDRRRDWSPGAQVGIGLGRQHGRGVRDPPAQTSAQTPAQPFTLGPAGARPPVPGPVFQRATCKASRAMQRPASGGLRDLRAITATRRSVRAARTSRQDDPGVGRSALFVADAAARVLLHAAQRAGRPRQG